MNDAALQDHYLDLKFAVKRSLRYHDYRQQYYKHWHDSVIFITIVLGILSMYLIAFGDELVKPVAELPWYAKAAPPFAIAVLNSLQLVFRFGDKYQLHKDLRVKFQKLDFYVKDLDIRGNINEETVQNGSAQRAEIEIDEPRTMQVLNVICHNEVNQALGYKHNYFYIKWYQKLFARFGDIGSLNFKEIKAT